MKVACIQLTTGGNYEKNLKKKKKKKKIFCGKFKKIERFSSWVELWDGLEKKKKILVENFKKSKIFDIFSICFSTIFDKLFRQKIR